MWGETFSEKIEFCSQAIWGLMCGPIELKFWPSINGTRVLTVEISFEAILNSWLLYIDLSIFLHCYCHLLLRLLLSRYLPLVVTKENFVISIKYYSGNFDFGPCFCTRIEKVVHVVNMLCEYFDYYCYYCWLVF